MGAEEVVKEFQKYKEVRDEFRRVTRDAREKFGYYSDEYRAEVKDVTSRYFSSQERPKAAFKLMVQEWLKEKGVEAFLTVHDTTYRDEYSISEVSAWNNKGCIDGRTRWMNKVVLATRWGPDRSTEWYVRSHKATTDAAFLSPFDEDFRGFIANLYGEIKNVLDKNLD